MAAIRRADASSFSSVPDERWLFENRLQIIKLTESAIQTLREVRCLPSEHGEARIMDICRRMTEENVFILSEDEIIARINDYQLKHSYLTVGELLYLRTYFHFVCIDILADGIRSGTLFRAGDAIRLMFALRDIDFERIYETVSYSESVLIRDPAGVYVRCDGATKSMYRRKLAEISRRFRMGEYETSKLILKNSEESEGKARHVGWHILKYSRHNVAAAIYFPTLYIVPAVMSGALAVLAYISGRTALFFGAVLSYLPLRAVTKNILDKLYALYDTPDILPRLSLDEIPPDGKTLLVYTVSLSGGKGDSEMFDRLETYARAYRCEGLGFAVLADLPDADSETTDEDERIITEAKSRIDRINDDGGEAYLFFRGREWSESERRYIGAERKRGAQAELFSLLYGGGSCLSVHGGAPSGYRYVLALDADTEILFSDIKKLIATALHPCCTPVISRSSGYPIVTDGYGVIAPEAQISLANAGDRKIYTAYKYAYGGRSEYERSSFSVYSYLFGVGSFCGKGLISVDAYMKTVYGAFPHERILSHDTAEGIRLRCGHASDLRVYDSVPRDYLRERSRSHRWIRGDVQSLCLLKRGIPSSSGEKYKNPVGMTGRLIMFEPVASVLTAIVRPATIILALIGGTSLGTLIYVAAVGDRFFKAVTLIHGAYRVPWRRYFSGTPNYYKSAAFEIIFALSSSADMSAFSSDAVYRAFYRMRFSKRRLLEWKTAASSDREAEGSALSYVKQMWVSVLLGVTALFSVLIGSGYVRFLLPVYGAAWFSFPIWMHSMNSVAVYTPRRCGNTDEDTRTGIAADAERMWRFFSDNVTSKYNFLPPDNVSIQPESKVAERTSPTNIGMYLLSTVNAYDFGLISRTELKTRLSSTLKTLERIEKWHGHLYNWYDIKTLDVLYPAYVSTVDSGNLVVCLVTVREAISELDGFEYIAECIKTLICGADFSALYNKKRNLFYIGYNSATGEYDKNVYDLYTGEILTTSFFAAATGQIPGDHLTSLGRVWSDEDGIEAMLSWSGSAFEYFMPSIFLPSVPGTARFEALSAANFFQRADSVLVGEKEMYGRSESSFYDFDDSLNYSYKANGCDTLAISPDIKKDNVLAPYSLYLLSQFDPESVLTLASHRNEDLYGIYGFYESIDLTYGRVGNEYGVSRLYMSHHIGMSLTSAANFMFSGINTARFCRDVSIRSALPLLYESIGINRRRSEERDRLNMEVYIPDAGKVDGSAINTDSAVISNGREKIVAKKSGEIVIYDGQTLLTQPMSHGCSDVTVLLRIGEEVYSCTAGARVQFSTDGTAISYVNEYVFRERIIKTELILTVAPASPTALIELSVSGINGRFEVLYMISPVMNTYAAYASAPSYSDLFITSEQLSEDTVKYSKKVSPGEVSVLNITVSHEDTDMIRIHTRKGDILPFGYTADDVASVFDAPSTCCNGACIHPVFAAVISGVRIGGEYKSGLALSMGVEPEHITADEARTGMQKHLSRTSALAGADNAAVRCAMELAGAIFDDENKIIACEDDIDIHFRRDVFWRYGISGDLPIITVFCCDLSSSADTFAISELIAAKRFLFVSGVRCDFVFIAPASGYLSDGTSKLHRMIKESGSERLLGKNNGIFIIDRDSISSDEELIFIASSYRFIDVGASHRFTVIKPDNSRTGYRIMHTEHRKHEIEYKNEGGVPFITNGKNESPYSMVYANAVFGTLLTNLTCGYSWYANSSLSTVSRRHTDPMLGEAGETVCLYIDGVPYDLARSSSTVLWGRGCALFCGRIANVEYELRVGVDARLPVKLYHLHIECDDDTDMSLLRAAFFFRPSAPSIFSRGRLRLMSEAAANVCVFAISDEIYDTAEVIGNAIRIQCAFSAGECGFAVAAYPRNEKCLFHIRDKFRRADLIQPAFSDYEQRVNSILLANAYSGGDAFLQGTLDYAAYQAVYVRILARSGYNQSGGAYGYRDQLQDSLSALYFRSDITKYQILRSCARQYDNGRVQHWWHSSPFGGGLRTHCSDDYMWLPYAAAEYVLATSDTDILSLRTPYLDSPQLREKEGDRYENASVTELRATVLEHCIAAISSSFDRGAHGLPLIGSGDWNDGMNEVGVHGIGESVWLAFFFAVVYRKFSEMLRYCEIDPMLSERLMYEADTLVAAVELTSWDGGWYVRAFDDDGQPLGSERCDECKIDLLPQAFSVFAEADRSRSETALRNVYDRLYDEHFGILRLFAPSYDRTERHGYICRYPAGIRENGGQYTHAAVWCAAAFFAIGEREIGTRLLSSMSPVCIYNSGRMGGKYSAEPYFLAADIYYGNSITGHSGWSGYTGSASWYYRITMKYYLGIELLHGNIVVTPPTDIEYDAALRVGGCEVKINVYRNKSPDDNDFDAVYSVRDGESVTIRPIGETMKISIKVSG